MLASKSCLTISSTASTPALSTLYATVTLMVTRDVSTSVSHMLRVRVCLWPSRYVAVITYSSTRIYRLRCQDVALSSGSACTSASLEPSYVLRALGAAEDMAHSSLRFGIGRFTTEAEVDYVVEKIVAVVERLREMRWDSLLLTSSLNAHAC